MRRSRSCSGWRSLGIGVAAGLVGGLLIAPITTSRPAEAAPARVGATLTPGTVDTYVRGAQSTRRPGRTTRSRPATKRPPTLQYLLLPNCPGNNPAALETEWCEESYAACGPGRQQFQVYEARLGTPRRATTWRQTRSACLDPTTAYVGEVVIPRLTGRELRQMPLPAGTSEVQPSTGYALVNLPTNIYSTTPAPGGLHTTLMGLRVEIRLHTTEFEWDFGDGTVLGPTDDPGGPYPNLTNTHTYTTPGQYEITMRTRYRGEFSVNGGAFQPIVGEGDVLSAPIPIEVLAGRNQLNAGER